MLFWLLLTAILVLLFAEAFFLASKRFDSIREKQITVEQIGLNGRRTKNLIVYEEDQAYYMSTGSFRTRASVKKISEAWENGTISSGDTVTIQYVDESHVPFRSYRYQNLIVSLQTEDTVYYELDTAKKIATENRAVTIILFFLILFFWLIVTNVFTLFAYDIVGRRKPTKRERKKSK